MDKTTQQNPTLQAHTLPTNKEGVRDFLASHWVEGIGRAYATKLVSYFGTSIIEELLNAPQDIAREQVIPATNIEKAHESLKSIKWDINLLVFLFSCGLTDTYIERIFNKYRKRAKEVVLTDPYSMVEDVWQLSFYTADKIGRALDIPLEDPHRLEGALVSAVKFAAEAGHLFETRQEAVAGAAKIAGVEVERVDKVVDATVASGRLISSKGVLYLPVFYEAEKAGAKKFAELSAVIPPQIVVNDIPHLSQNGHVYSDSQRFAIMTAVNSPISCITGGPGTGKTTVIKGVIDIVQSQHKTVVLCAPTGRAAKRMSSLTGHHASTIHSLLGYRQGEGYHNKKLKADMLVIDEGSMMEQVLFNHLLQALQPGTQVLLVGDTDQLPAIGAGNVLSDMIESGRIPIVNLNENFRQSEGSLIAAGAHSINRGDIPISDPNKDLMIIIESGVEAIREKIIKLISEELPRTHHINSSDILVVTPQQIGKLGARQLNIDLQQRLNPTGAALVRGTSIFRWGDPVMQTANSVQRGVYNGEVGHITAVDEVEQTLEVTFSDGRQSVYHRTDLSELVLAYATTIHKLQGSEVPNVIIPVTMLHKPMLYRNLLYTGVSRATNLCVLVGEENALEYAVGNVPSGSRNSNFKSRLGQLLPPIQEPNG